MKICIGPSGTLVLEDVEDFSALSVSVACGVDLLEEAVVKIGWIEAGGYVWVSRTWLLENGQPDDPAWRAGFESMLAYAKNHYWIDERTDCVRAHVEFSS